MAHLPLTPGKNQVHQQVFLKKLEQATQKGTNTSADLYHLTGGDVALNSPAHQSRSNSKVEILNAADAGVTMR